jgi:hypothetical protein
MQHLDSCKTIEALKSCESSGEEKLDFVKGTRRRFMQENFNPPLSVWQQILVLFQ